MKKLFLVNDVNPKSEQERDLLIPEHDQAKILDKFIEETEDIYKDALRKHVSPKNLYSKYNYDFISISQ